jgi:hypothetical protein
MPVGLSRVDRLTLAEGLDALSASPKVQNRGRG